MIEITYLVLFLGWMSCLAAALICEWSPYHLDDGPADAAAARQVRRTSRRYFFAGVPLLLTWLVLVASWWKYLSMFDVITSLGIAAFGVSLTLAYCWYCRSPLRISDHNETSIDENKS